MLLRTIAVWADRDINTSRAQHSGLVTRTAAL
jgi:hypothetical protein